MRQAILNSLHNAKREDIEEALASIIILCSNRPDWTDSDYRHGWNDSRLSLYEITNLQRFI